MKGGVIIRYPNQMNVEVVRSNCVRGSYMSCDREAMDVAACNLSASSFKLFYYFVRNADGFKINLSPVAVKDVVGISKTSYYRALQELKDKGYLCQPNSDVNNWVFTEKP